MIPFTMIESVCWASWKSHFVLTVVMWETPCFVVVRGIPHGTKWTEWNRLQSNIPSSARQLVISFSRVILHALALFQPVRMLGMVVTSKSPGLRRRATQHVMNVASTSFTWSRCLPIDPKWPITYGLWGRCDDRQSGAFQDVVHPRPVRVLVYMTPQLDHYHSSYLCFQDRTPSSRDFQSNTWKEISKLDRP
jgi:hypothetical protein